MKTIRIALILCLTITSGLSVFGQDEDIVAIIDQLTVEWDETALKMETYDGLKTFCQEKVFRDNSVRLLDQIHHYDSVLYALVTEKYDTDGNKEAKKTLDDIEELESDFTTREFLSFLRKECTTVNEIELGKGTKNYESDIKKLEKEAIKYVLGITAQIDLVDEHVHHLGDL